jgi:hypothetical protein
MKYLALLIAGIISLAGVLSAQITTSTEAVGIHYNKQWSSANITSGLLDVYDWGQQKGNSLSLMGYALTAPGPGFSSYLGGVSYIPDISKLMKLTNIPSDQFNLHLEGAAGESIFGTTTTPATPNKFTFSVGIGAHYRVSPSIAWSAVDIRCGWVGSSSFCEASSGLSYIANPETSKSLAVKRYLVRVRVRQSYKQAATDSAEAAASSVK